MDITKVQRWVTSDRKEHSSHECATEWEDKITAAANATKMLKDGSSVADCLRAMHTMPNIDPILERVTNETKLVISYWQCRDTPGYKVKRFQADGLVYVSGNAGSWSGAYGNVMRLAELVRHAKHRNTQLQG
jgi:hypothetical protein